jgi:purine-binding chemotaxis protein CheW
LTETEVAQRETLVFTLGAEEYGVDILKVQEIRGYDASAVTSIVTEPACIKGVINLRGNIVPVVDLREKFGIGRVEYGATTVTIILNVSGRTVGVVVDGVSDVVVFKSEQIRPAPELGSGVGVEFVDGLGVLDGRMIILLAIERLILANDIETMSGLDQGTNREQA